MNWLKNLFNKKKKKPEWQSIERDEKGRWKLPKEETLKPLLGVVTPPTCKCGGKCLHCQTELNESIARHPAGKKKTNVTDGKPSSPTKKSITSNDSLLGKNGKTKTTPSGKNPTPKPNGTGKSSNTK